jgi:ATP-dependent exoDNAse (exonuclease V) beta subunit
VTTLDRDVSGRLPSLAIEYTDFSDLAAVLENARIEFSPKFAAPETNDRFQGPLDEKARAEGLNLLYVALTRAKEQLVIEWPQNLATSTRYTFWHLLGESAGMRLKGSQMEVDDAAFNCRVTAADSDPPADFHASETPTPQMLPVLGRRALKASAKPEALTPQFVTPSRLHGTVTDMAAADVSTISYAKQPKLAIASGAGRGLIVHRALELLGQGVSEDVARRAVGSESGDADWGILQTMARQFTETLYERFKPSALHWEVPIVAADRFGSVINGTIDLLVETKDGYWILDHKSDETEEREERFAIYWPQLECYARAIKEEMGAAVLGVAIHWACFGEISLTKYGS